MILASSICAEFKGQREFILELLNTHSHSANGYFLNILWRACVATAGLFHSTLASCARPAFRVV